MATHITITTNEGSSDYTLSTGARGPAGSGGGALNGLTITPTTGTLTIADGKTLTASNTLTLAGTDASTLNIGTGGTLGSAAFTASTAYQAALGNPAVNFAALVSTTTGTRSWTGGQLVIGTGGHISISNGAALSVGGNIDTSNGANDGGSINTSGGEDNGGGSINTSNGGGGIDTSSLGSVFRGGDINTSTSGGLAHGGNIYTFGGAGGPGGGINTSNGGGDINTTAGGSITTGAGDLTGPNTNGTIALAEQTADLTLSNLSNAGTARTNLGAGTTGSSLFTAATAAAARTTLELEETYVSAPSDSATRGNNTLADDSVLAGVSLAANSRYHIRCFAIFTCATTAGIQCRLALSAVPSAESSQYYGHVTRAGNLELYNLVQSTGLGATITRASITTSPLPFYFDICINTAAAITLALQWSQVTTDAGNPATRKGGSWISVKKLNR